MEVGKEMRDAATSRTRKETDEEKIERKKARKRKHDECDDDEWNKIVKTQLKMKHEQEQTSNNVRAAKLQLMHERF